MELIVSGLLKTFYSSSGDATFSLEMPTLELQTGFIYYIVGPNGSGKTVFLKLLNNDFAPTNNYLEIQSPEHLDVTLMRQRAEDNLFLSLSVEENVLLHLPPRSLIEHLFPKKQMKARIKRLLEGFNLTKMLQRPCSDLSGGEKQSLAFLLATSKNCRMLCLDEFLSSIDIQTSKRLRVKVREYAERQDAVVLIVSHDFDIALQDADEILVLKNGKLTHRLKRGAPQWNKPNLVQLVYPD